MLTIKAYVSNSKIHRMGCFTDVDIKKDTIVWMYSVEETYDKPISYLEKWGWFDSLIDMYVYPMDCARYINHTEDANTYEDNGMMKAKRDIKAGEEITENYKDYMSEHDIQKHLGGIIKKKETL